jgi:hypothetical protein
LSIKKIEITFEIIHSTKKKKRQSKKKMNQMLNNQVEKMTKVAPTKNWKFKWLGGG